jgi:tetratricopeptide (TPR) repeat protein
MMSKLFEEESLYPSAPVGESHRQAVASLRGYAYQLYVAALAWLEIDGTTELHLEVAEDYAIVARDAVKAVQVKDTPAATVTIQSPEVRQAIDSFVRLCSLNPGRKISLRFLSTAKIGRERRKADRIGDVPALQYWRRAAVTGDVEPLRQLLLRLKLSDETKAFIESVGNDVLREQLLRRIQWDCGAKPLPEIKKELDQALVYIGSARLQLPADESRKLGDLLLGAILEKIVQPDDRKLVAADVIELMSRATKVSISHRALEAMLSQMALGPLVDTKLALTSSRILADEDQLPLPQLLSQRRTLAAAVNQKLDEFGSAVLTAGTGMGKTLASRLAVRARGARWAIADLRDEAPAVVAVKLHAMQSELLGRDLSGVIFDDANHLEDSTVASAMAVTLGTLRRRDLPYIITAYSPLSARALSTLGLSAEAHHAVPDLSVEEVAELVDAAGGNADMWAKGIHAASSFGHPQLAQAIIVGLRRRGWPIEDHPGLPFAGPVAADMAEERRHTRKRLLAAIPADSRSLLYRLSILIGRFDRDMVLAMGAAAPAIELPAEKLDQLIGPWIDLLDEGEMRISPLASGVGNAMLAPEQISLLHKKAAETIMGGASVNIIYADQAFLHGLIGKADFSLTRLAYSVIKASGDDTSMLSNWLTSLRFCRIDVLIYPTNPTVSKMLRLAQFILVAERDDPARTRAVSETLLREERDEPGLKGEGSFEHIILFKLLINQNAAGTLANWFDLLLRLDELMQATPRLRDWNSKWESAKEAPPGYSVLGFLFLIQTIKVNGVAELAAIFDRLDAAPPDQRRRLLPDPTSMPGDFSMLVNRAWLAEHNSEGVDWLTAADRFRRMADQAANWGVPELALRCHIARGIMLDEYSDDPTGALAALDEAQLLLGPQPALHRARAKVLFRRKEHEQSLELIRAVAGQVAQDDPIERAYMLREAGICAGELGLWSEAYDWFAQAREAAEAVQASQLVLMALGLLGDMAVASAHKGEAKAALEEMANALVQLRTIDPTESIKHGFCHRILLHTASWLTAKLEGRRVELADGVEFAMLPGMCSNPEPKDTSSLPLGSIDVVFYLLAQCGLRVGAGADLNARLVQYLTGREIPFCEMMLRQDGLEAAIRALDVEEVGFWLPRYVAAQLYRKSFAPAFPPFDVIDPEYAELGVPDSSALSEPPAVEVVEEALLVFGVRAALDGREDCIAALTKLVEAQYGAHPALSFLNVLNGAKAQDTTAEAAAAAIFRVVQRQTLTPNDLFLVSVRLIEVAARSLIGGAIRHGVTRWCQAAWSKAVKEQRFLLILPNITASDIAAAIEQPGEGLVIAANIVLVAEAAVDHSLSPEFREFMKRIVD